ncbi:outer membrane protein [Synechococcus phage DSL-LC02]|nr:outer membrane protein [Synechococcus phage DSL-LC02]
MKQFIALAALPVIAAPAMAAPYVESKTTAGLSDGTYKGAQTELRIGYEQQAAKGVTVYGEIGPGYEWTKGSDTTTGEAVAVAEVGVKAKVTDKVGVQAKVTGEYGDASDIFDMGGELKVRYSF